jgi:hypothetical protein
MSAGKRAWIAIVVAGALLGAFDPGAAQDRPLRIEGRVAWISGNTLVLVPDGSPSVNVDLTQLPQDQQATLREGDRIVVTGAVPNERNRIVAAAIRRLGP